MYAAEILGLIAGFFTTIAYLPQVIKSYKTGSTKDLSTLWLTISGVGTTLWIFYGFWIGSPPIILWNACSDVLIAVLLSIKIKHSRGRRLF